MVFASSARFIGNGDDNGTDARSNESELGGHWICPPRPLVISPTAVSLTTTDLVVGMTETMDPVMGRAVAAELGSCSDDEEGDSGGSGNGNDEDGRDVGCELLGLGLQLFLKFFYFFFL